MLIGGVQAMKRPRHAKATHVGATFRPSLPDWREQWCLPRPSPWV